MYLTIILFIIFLVTRITSNLLVEKTDWREIVGFVSFCISCIAFILFTVVGIIQFENILYDDWRIWAIGWIVGSSI